MRYQCTFCCSVQTERTADWFGPSIAVRNTEGVAILDKFSIIRLHELHRSVRCCTCHLATLGNLPFSCPHHHRDFMCESSYWNYFLQAPWVTLTLTFNDLSPLHPSQCTLLSLKLTVQKKIHVRSASSASLEILPSLPGSLNSSLSLGHQHQPYNIFDQYSLTELTTPEC